MGSLYAEYPGKPSSLHYDSNKERQNARRKEALAGYPSRGDGTEREEYPYASTFEGGKGAVVSYVPAREQRIQGGELVNFYKKLTHGEEFLVLPVPRDKEPDAPNPLPIAEVNSNKNKGNNTRGNPGNVFEMNLKPAETGAKVATAAIVAYWVFRVARIAVTWECGGCGGWAF